MRLLQRTTEWGDPMQNLCSNRGGPASLTASTLVGPLAAVSLASRRNPARPASLARHSISRSDHASAAITIRQYLLVTKVRQAHPACSAIDPLWLNLTWSATSSALWLMMDTGRTSVMELPNKWGTRPRILRASTMCLASLGRRCSPKLVNSHHSGISCWPRRLGTAPRAGRTSRYGAMRLNPPPIASEVPKHPSRRTVKGKIVPNKRSSKRY